MASAAALYRTAVDTIVSWPDWKKQLDKAALESLPLDDLAEGRLSPSFWDSPPIASNLNRAYSCFPGDPKLAEGVRKFLDQNVSDGLLPSPALPGDFSRCRNIQKQVFTMNYVLL